jgi:hypothetical protein
MTDLGSLFSSAIGGNKDESKSQVEGKIVYKSPTTNSYGKCLNNLSKNFTDEQMKLARNAIDKHDQNSFIENVILGSVYEEEGSSRKQTHNKILVIKGTYQHVFIAHLKTIEMWIETKPI